MSFALRPDDQTMRMTSQACWLISYSKWTILVIGGNNLYLDSVYLGSAAGHIVRPTYRCTVVRVLAMGLPACWAASVLPLFYLCPPVPVSANTMTRPFGRIWKKATVKRRNGISLIDWGYKCSVFVWFLVLLIVVVFCFFCVSILLCVCFYLVLAFELYHGPFSSHALMYVFSLFSFCWNGSIAVWAMSIHIKSFVARHIVARANLHCFRCPMPIDLHDIQSKCPHLECHLIEWYIKLCCIKCEGS